MSATEEQYALAGVYGDEIAANIRALVISASPGMTIDVVHGVLPDNSLEIFMLFSITNPYNSKEEDVKAIITSRILKLLSKPPLNQYEIQNAFEFVK